MKVHYLNCGTMQPLFGRLVTGPAPAALGPVMPSVCLLLETNRAGLVLIDTGFGLADCAHPRQRLSASMRWTTRPRLDAAETACRQIEALGHRPEDVRHIIMTHMDPDHTGGLSDFPWARVHVHAPELEAAQAPQSRAERHRYRTAHWAHGADFVPHGDAGEPWFGLDTIAIDGLDAELRLVPLIGHSRGHAAVAIDTGAGWVLHAGDAYFHRDETRPTEPSCPRMLRLFQRIIEIDRQRRLACQQRLRDLMAAHGDQISLVASHDLWTFADHLDR